MGAQHIHGGSMQLLDLLIIGILLSMFGGAVYLANQQQAMGTRSPVLRWLLVSLSALPPLVAVLVLQAALIDPALLDQETPLVDGGAALANLASAMLLAAISAGVLTSPRARLAIARLPGVRFDVESPVHRTAIVLLLAVLSLILGQFVLNGGISGLAENYAEQSVSISSVLLEQALWVLAALLGVGWLLRRNSAATLARLGLRWPTLSDTMVGVGVGVGMFFVTIGISAVWVSQVSPEQLAEQTAASSELAASFSTIPLAFALSILAATGEEFFFRGALQPIFGIGLTSLYFVLLHTQYTLTPAALAILVLALVLGWVRRRFSTTAAILAHFLFNFIQLGLAALFASGAAS